MASSPIPGCRHTCEEIFSNRKVSNKKISYLWLEAQTTRLYDMQVEMGRAYYVPVTDRVKAYAFRYPGRRVRLVMSRRQSTQAEGYA